MTPNPENSSWHSQLIAELGEAGAAAYLAETSRQIAIDEGDARRRDAAKTEENRRRRWDWLRAPPTPAAPLTQTVPEVGEPAELRGNTLQTRAELLVMFRQEGGKRPSEPGKRGTRGALARVAEKSGIDKDTLGDRLDRAIEEKRRVDTFPQTAAKR